MFLYMWAMAHAWILCINTQYTYVDVSLFGAELPAVPEVPVPWATFAPSQPLMPLGCEFLGFGGVNVFLFLLLFPCCFFLVGVLLQRFGCVLFLSETFSGRFRGKPSGNQPFLGAPLTTTHSISIVNKWPV